MGHSRSTESGFSIIEISAVVAIAAIITTMSAVMFGKARQRYAVTQNAQKIAWQIERARSLAVKYNQTLTLGFTSSNTKFGLTCTSCPEASSELSSLSLPMNVTLSAYPTLTIKGNGTIQSTSATVVVDDGQGRQVPITIANSGRTTVGDITESNAAVTTPTSH